MLTHANKAIAQYLHAVTSGMISHTQDVLLRSAMTKNYSSAEVAALYASLMNSPLRPSYTNWSTKLHTADLTSEFAASFISTLTHALALLPLRLYPLLDTHRYAVGRLRPASILDKQPCRHWPENDLGSTLIRSMLCLRIAVLVSRTVMQSHV